MPVSRDASNLTVDVSKIYKDDAAGRCGHEGFARMCRLPKSQSGLVVQVAIVDRSSWFATSEVFLGISFVLQGL